MPRMRARSIVLALACAAAGAGGCKPTDRPLVDQASWPALHVSLLVPRPAGDAVPTDVPTNVIVRLFVDRAPVAADVNDTTVRLESGGTPLAAAVAYDSIDHEITIRPADPLPAGATIDVIAGPAIHSYGGPLVEGEPMRDAARFSFVTGAGPDTTPPTLGGTYTLLAESFDEYTNCDPTFLSLCGNRVCDENDPATGMRHECASTCPTDCGRPFVLRADVGDVSVKDDTSAAPELRWVAYVATSAGGQDFAAPPNHVIPMDAAIPLQANDLRILGLGQSAVCGDGACTGIERFATCPADCAAFCGNGTCDTGETVGTCRRDCFGRTCGDATCVLGEQDPAGANFCAADCPLATCNDGNGTCDPGETCDTCPGDCGDCCRASSGDGTCALFEDPLSCPADCPTTCGDGFCMQGETPEDCPGDCSYEFFVVLRAVDAAGNESTNTLEVGGFTGPTAPLDDTDGDGVEDAPSWRFARDHTNCETCQQCHSVAPGPVDFWMPTVAWAPGDEDPDPYALLVGVPSRESPILNVVEPFNAARSYLVLKRWGRCGVRLYGATSSGFPMPPDPLILAGDCEETLNVVLAASASLDWIDYGAPENTPAVSACSGK
jgi:hypothetical protein